MEKIKLEQIEELGYQYITDIVPTLVKAEYANRIANQCYSREGSLAYTCNEIEKLMLSRLYMVALYTNIEITEATFEIYDKLLTMNIFEEVLEANEDAQAFLDIVDLKCAEFEKNNDMNHIVAEYFNRFLMNADESMNHINALLDRIDPNELNASLGKGLEVFANKIPDLNDEKMLTSLMKLLPLIQK